MSIVLEVVGWIVFTILQLIGDVVGGSIAGRVERRKDRRLLAQGKVKCGIRAVKDRVHNLAPSGVSGSRSRRPGTSRSSRRSASSAIVRSTSSICT